MTTKRIAFALLLACAMNAQAGDTFEVAVTVDDLPSHGPLPAGMTRLGIARAHLEAFKAHKVAEAFGFVNSAKLDADPDNPAVLDAWRAAGHPLGNHTASHLNLARAPSLEAWKADVEAGEAAVASRMQGQDWRYLRFANLALGERAGEALPWLKARGYRVADVSLAFSDWSYTDAYARCRDKGDNAAIEAMKAHYLNSVDATIAQMKAHSKLVYGRVIPMVLLTHAGGWSAATLLDVLARLDAAGARYVTLAKAQSDPAYAQAGGGNLITRAAKQKGIALPPAAPVGPGPDLKAICR